MKIFKCDRCAQILYFENTRCLNCGLELGFLPELRVISSLEPQGEERWKALAPKAAGALYKKCNNYKNENVCNWMIEAASPKNFCFACDLNLTIPNLNKEENRDYWRRLEVAKRRLLYALLKLRLPIVSREIDPVKGLGFQFLEDEPVRFVESKKVMTGHANGIITINLEEADDATRVKMQIKMKEDYRTILGHFRHEIGHFYWAQLVENKAPHEAFRALFGDERKNYTRSLKSFYGLGAPLDWRDHYVSAYCASHPWEDWAETWAHYLHMVDTLETAQAWGLRVQPRPDEDELPQPIASGFFSENHWVNFDMMYENWTKMTAAINSMNRSMGQADFYPFVLSQKAVEKLKFVDSVITTAFDQSRSS